MNHKSSLTVLSLFDGMACGREALKRQGIPVSRYFASEIDPHAVSIARKNHPDIVHLGDVRNWRDWDIPNPDLILAGSPCQGFSNAGQRLNFDDPRSALYFEFENILDHYNPHYYLLENVKMKKEWQNIITDRLNQPPILINSSLVSAQNRERLYWTNIPYLFHPADQGILLKDVVFPDAYPVVLHNLYGGFKEKSVRVFVDKSPTIRTAAGGGHIPSVVLKDLIHSEKAIEYMNRKRKDGRTGWDFAHHYDVRKDKSSAVVANFFKGVPYNVFKDWNVIRKFHPIECERLQTLPDHYTDGVSNTQRYKMIGNGWTINVITHILKGI